MIFDTLGYTKGAMLVGIKREHAEYQAGQLARLVSESLTTKEDLKELKNELIIALGSIVVTCSGVVIAALGYILK